VTWRSGLRESVKAADPLQTRHPLATAHLARFEVEVSDKMARLIGLTPREA
jgi:hypothetical protein